MKNTLPSSLVRSPAWRKMMDFYVWLKPGLWLMRLPLLGPILQRKFIVEGHDANWFLPPVPASPDRVRIAIGEPVAQGQQQALPALVIERLLREADGIFAMAACPCRAAFHCRSHPWDIGCLHIGPATRGIPGELGHELSLEEGIEYLNRAVTSGLIPTILYIPSEAEIFGVDKTRMLSICFCCECCCDVRLMLRSGPDRYWDLYNHRLPGVQVIVDAQRCTGCGACAGACYGGERVIDLASGKASIGQRCIGCGLCASACPTGAIAITIDSRADWMNNLLDRISAKAAIH